MPADVVIAPPSNAHCRNCQYSLRGLASNRCPECGTEFDPSDPSTMRIGSPMSQVAAVLAGPLPRWIPRAVIVCCWMILWGAAWLPGAFYVEWMGWIALVGIVGYARVRRILRAIVRWWMHIDDPIDRRAEKFRLRQILVLWLAMSSNMFAWPLRVNLLLHRPLLDRFAHHTYEVAPLLDPPSTPRMIGLLVVSESDVRPGGIVLDVFGGGVLEYSPDEDYYDKSWLSGLPLLIRWNFFVTSGRWRVVDYERILWPPVLYR